MAKSAGKDAPTTTPSERKASVIDANGELAVSEVVNGSNVEQSVSEPMNDASAEPVASDPVNDANAETATTVLVKMGKEASGLASGGMEKAFGGEEKAPGGDQKAAVEKIKEAQNESRVESTAEQKVNKKQKKIKRKVGASQDAGKGKGLDSDKKVQNEKAKKQKKEEVQNDVKTLNESARKKRKRQKGKKDKVLDIDAGKVNVLDAEEMAKEPNEEDVQNQKAKERKKEELQNDVEIEIIPDASASKKRKRGKNKLPAVDIKGKILVDDGKAKMVKEEVQHDVKAKTTPNEKSKKLKKKKQNKAGRDAAAKDAEKKPEPSAAGNDSKKAKSMGMIFMCSSKTKKDCYRYKIFGLPASKKDIVGKIYKGMRLFLFDIDLKLLYGIYKAAGPGGYNIEPKAFNSAFPSQVRFSVLQDCLPLGEEKFKPAIKSNYYARNKFNCQLTPQQVKELCKLFRAVNKKASKLKRSEEDSESEASPTRERNRKRRVPDRVGRPSLEDYRYRRQRDMYERDPYASPPRARPLPPPLYASPPPRAQLQPLTSYASPPPRAQLQPLTSYASPPPRAQLQPLTSYASPPPRAQLQPLTSYASPPHARWLPPPYTSPPPAQLLPPYASAALPPPLPPPSYASTLPTPSLPPPSYASTLPTPSLPPPSYTYERPPDDYYYRIDPHFDRRALYTDLRHQPEIEYRDPYRMYREPAPSRTSLYPQLPLNYQAPRYPHIEL